MSRHARSKRRSGDEFVRLHNELTDLIRARVRSSERLTFNELVDLAAQNDTAIAEFSMPLKSFGRLRNAIVHYKRFPRKIIADPRKEILDEFRDIVSKLKSPPRASEVSSRVTRVFSTTDDLVDALVYMKECDFSQIVVKHAERFGLLTCEGVAKWLEAHLHGAHREIKSAKVGEAYIFEPKGSVEFLRSDQTVYDARAVFSGAIQAGKPRLYAILFTHDGRSDQRPVGIMTPWDLIKLDK